MTGRIAARAIGGVRRTLGEAFVLEGPDGARLLVLRQDGANRALLAVGQRVAVSGKVAALRPSVDELPAAVHDLAESYDAAAVLRASEVAARAG